MRTLLLLAISLSLTASDPSDRLARARLHAELAQAELSAAQEAYTKDMTGEPRLTDSEVKARNRELDRLKATAKAAIDMVAILEAKVPPAPSGAVQNQAATSIQANGVPVELQALRDQKDQKRRQIADLQKELESIIRNEQKVVADLAIPFLKSLDLNSIAPTITPNPSNQETQAAVKSAAEANEVLGYIRYAVETIEQEPDIQDLLLRINAEWHFLRKNKPSLPEWPAWAPATASEQSTRMRSAWRTPAR